MGSSRFGIVIPDGLALPQKLLNRDSGVRVRKGDRK